MNSKPKTKPKEDAPDPCLELMEMAGKHIKTALQSADPGLFLLLAKSCISHAEAKLKLKPMKPRFPSA